MVRFSCAAALAAWIAIGIAASIRAADGQAAVLMGAKFEAIPAEKSPAPRREWKTGGRDTPLQSGLGEEMDASDRPRRFRVVIEDCFGQPLPGVVVQKSLVSGPAGEVELDVLESPVVLCVNASNTTHPKVLGQHYPFVIEEDLNRIRLDVGWVEGIAIDECGRPLRFAQVESSSTGRSYFWVVNTDEQGRFRILVPDGTDSHVALTGSFEAKEGELWSGFGCSVGLVKGTASVSPGDKNVVLKWTGLDTGGSLDVEVRAPDGSPIEGAGVQLVGRRPDIYYRAVTDERGWARFQHVARQPSRVSLRWESEDPRTREWVTPGFHDVLPDGQCLVIQCRARRQIPVRLHAGPHDVFEKTTVQVIRGDQVVSSGHTDAIGLVVLFMDPQLEAPLRLRVTARTQDGAAWTADIPDFDPGQAELDLSLVRQVEEP
ncbi:MAG: carboxypeptidase regulatory-like domain-containing protein [Planctomycetes bacterium]|nr:carboxypeptidase regulatory-like domain-containing protein [Planctomycetota bacterium]